MARVALLRECAKFHRRPPVYGDSPAVAQLDRNATYRTQVDIGNLSAHLQGGEALYRRLNCVLPSHRDMAWPDHPSSAQKP